jgi:hypothetical protein
MRNHTLAFSKYNYYYGNYWLACITVCQRSAGIDAMQRAKNSHLPFGSAAPRATRDLTIVPSASRLMASELAYLFPAHAFARPLLVSIPEAARSFAPAAEQGPVEPGVEELEDARPLPTAL